MVPRRIKEVLSMRGSSTTGVILRPFDILRINSAEGLGMTDYLHETHWGSCVLAVGAGPCACLAGQPRGVAPTIFPESFFMATSANEKDNAHALRKRVAVFFNNLRLQLGAGSRDERIIFHPFIGTRGVDDGASAETFFVLRYHRIERTAPGAADEVY